MFPPKILNRKWFVVLTVYCIEGFKWLLPLLSTESLQRCFCFLVLCDSKWSFDYSYVAKKKKKNGYNVEDAKTEKQFPDNECFNTA